MLSRKSNTSLTPAVILSVGFFCACQHKPPVAREPQSLPTPLAAILEKAPIRLAPLGEEMGSVREDMKIYGQVSEMVRRLDEGGYDIYVAVTNGIVELTGTFSDTAERQKLIDQVRDIPGVKSLRDQLSLSELSDVKAGVGGFSQPLIWIFAVLLALGIFWQVIRAYRQASVRKTKTGPQGFVH